MSIHDFHSKLVSSRREGKLIEALRELRRLESVKSFVDEEEELAAWSVWTDGETYQSLATAKT